VSHIHLSRVNRGWVIRCHDHVTPAEFADTITTIRAAGGGNVRWFVCEPTNDERACAAHHGLQADAPLLHMRCALPLNTAHQLPAGFVTRPFRAGVDNQAWLAVNARAFAAHPEQGSWTNDVLIERLAEPWFDPQGFLIHQTDGHMTGFCWTQMHDHSAEHDHAEAHDDLATHDHHGAAPAGEIYVVGVDPSHHGKGLGRALTIAGFAYLASRGLQHGMLYVAGNNTAAITLYESLGMTVAHSDDVFIGTVSR